MRKITNMSKKESQKNGWQTLKPLNCEVVGKAIFDDTVNRDGSPNLAGMSIMKSTKRFRVVGGWIYNTSTEIHKRSQVAIAEALVFVPSGSKK